MISPNLRTRVVRHMFMCIYNFNKYLFNESMEIVDFVSNYLKVEIFMPEGDIINEGDPADRIYFLSQGECEVKIQDEKKRNQLARYLHPGNIFGEIALIYKCNRTATIKCINYVSTTSITTYEFYLLTESFPEFF